MKFYKRNLASDGYAQNFSDFCNKKPLITPNKYSHVAHLGNANVWFGKALFDGVF